MSARDHFRAHGRIRVDLDATLVDHEGKARAVTIRDLSLAGAGLEIAEPADSSSNTPELAPEVSVILELNSPNLWDPLRVHGTIAWIRKSTTQTRPARAGMRFEHQDASHLLSLFHVL